MSRLSRPAALFASALFLLAPAVSAWAEPAPQHGIAMHGAPKYGPGFAHLDYANPNAPKGGTIRHAAIGSFDSLNPYIVKGRAAVGLFAVYETLLQRVWDEPFSLYGLLAENVSVPEDRSWVEFTLNPGARWHDGRPVTVEDVLFSFETLRAKGRPNHRSYYGKVAKAEKTGERSVRFTFGPEGDRELPLIMGSMPILAKHWWEGRNFEETLLEPPLGSGPYRVASVDPGRSITYERVADYWGKDLPVNVGHHNFDRIRYDYYRDDGIALEALKGGEVDFRREGDPNKWATGYDIPAVKDGRITLESLPHGRPEPMRALIFNHRRVPFDQRGVREALAQALDFDWINRNLLHGSFRRTQSYYPNSELAASGAPSAQEIALLEPWKAELPPEALSKPFELPASGADQARFRAMLRRAGNMLTEAGWTVKDGKRVDAQGNPLSFEILLADPSDEKFALEFSRALNRLGVEARIRTVDSAQYQSRLENFDFDMTLNRWISTLSPGNEQLIYWGSKAADQPGSRNYAGIKSPMIDALAGGLANARTREELVNGVRALDRALLWGHHVIPLWHLPEDRVAYSSKLQHPEKIPLYGLVIETWWAKE